MSRLHIKSMDNFSSKAKLLGLDINKQLELLNNAYKGDVVFGIYDNNSTIAIENINKNILGLVLPSCEYINYERLFGYIYRGNLSFLKVPKNHNNEIIKLSKLDYKCNFLNAVVFQDGTELVIDTDEFKFSYPSMIVIEKNNGNNIIYKLNDRR